MIVSTTEEVSSNSLNLYLLRSHRFSKAPERSGVAGYKFSTVKFELSKPRRGLTRFSVDPTRQFLYRRHFLYEWAFYDRGMGGYGSATHRLGTTHCRFGMRPAPAVFRDLQTGFGDKFPCTRTSDQPAKIGQRRHPNGTGHHACRKFIQDLLGQVDRQVFQMVSNSFAFRIHQILGVFEIGRISTTP